MKEQEKDDQTTRREYAFKQLELKDEVSSLIAPPPPFPLLAPPFRRLLAPPSPPPRPPRYSIADDAVAALAASPALRTAHPPRQILRVEAHPSIEQTIRPAIEAALVAGSWGAIDPSLLSPNVDQDHPLERRAKVVAGLAAVHGALRPTGKPVRVKAPTRVFWWLEGEKKGSVRVNVALTPECPPRILTLDIDSFPHVRGGALESAIHDAVEAVGAGQSELSSVAAPIRSIIGWVSCDATCTKGSVLVEGAYADVVVGVDLRGGSSGRLSTWVTPAGAWKCQSLPV